MAVADAPASRACDPQESLDALARALADAGYEQDRCIADAIIGGATWSDVGAVLGVTGQEAQAGFNRRAADFILGLAAAPELSEDEAMRIAVETVNEVRREHRATA